MQQNDKPLSSLTVVEHATGVAAQYCARLLAVLGARVIKVEPPGGIAMRREPPLLSEAPPRSALFEYLNVGKLAASCDLAGEDGQRRLRALLETADVFIDDTPVAQRQGVLDPAAWADHPRLVYVSVLPFGAHGAHAGWQGRELNLLHAGGEGYLMPNGLTIEMFPDRPPVKIHGHFAEFVGGMSGLCATLGAVLAQSRAGGQFVDVSVQDANLAIGCFAMQRLGDGVLETRHARSFKYGGVIECRDGFVEVLVLEQHQWSGLVELMGRPDWALDPAFDDPLERGRRGAEINRGLRAWARSQAVADVVARGQACSVPVAPYNPPQAVLHNDRVSGRARFAEADLPGLGAFPVFTGPFQFANAALAPGRGIGEPGADNAQVFAAAAEAPGAGGATLDPALALART